MSQSFLEYDTRAIGNIDSKILWLGINIIQLFFPFGCALNV